MGIWRRRHGRARASRHTLAILDEVETKLLALGEPYPTVKSIRIGAGLPDLHDFETEVELAPGAVAAFGYQSVDEEGRNPDALENEGGAVAWQIVDAAKDLHGLGAGALADLLHDVRVRTRRLLARWWADGVQATLLDARLVATEFWYVADGPIIELLLVVFDDRLLPTVHAVEIERPEDLEAELFARLPKFATGFAAPAALYREGADYMVDQLVLNCIARHCDVAKALRGIVSGEWYALSEDLSIYMTDGHLMCHGRSADGVLSWNRNSITMHGRLISDAMAVALHGRPISALVEHPVLTDDMTITEVVSGTEFGVSSVRAEFIQPVLPFCGASGRTWTLDSEPARNTTTEEP